MLLLEKLFEKFDHLAEPPRDNREESHDAGQLDEDNYYVHEGNILQFFLVLGLTNSFILTPCKNIGVEL